MYLLIVVISFCGSKSNNIFKMLKLACMTVVMVGKQFTLYLLRTGTKSVFLRPQLRFSQLRLGP